MAADPSSSDRRATPRHATPADTDAATQHMPVCLLLFFVCWFLSGTGLLLELLIFFVLFFVWSVLIRVGYTLLVLELAVFSFLHVVFVYWFLSGTRLLRELFIFLTCFLFGLLWFLPGAG